MLRLLNTSNFPWSINSYGGLVFMFSFDMQKYCYFISLRTQHIRAFIYLHDKYQLSSNNQPIPNANEYLLISIANKKWTTGFRSKLLIWFIHAVQINRHAFSSRKISVGLYVLLSLSPSPSTSLSLSAYRRLLFLTCRFTTFRR